MTETRHSVPLLLTGISILAIGLAASPIAIDIHQMRVGNNAARAQGGGVPEGGAHQPMGMQQGPMSQSMTSQVQGQTMTREIIRSVQRRLNQLGYRAGPEDGIIGRQTSEAIWAYQNRMGMAPDGMATPDLVDRLMGGSRGQNAK
jgi:Putative peptidoglycan binding domain